MVEVVVDMVILALTLVELVDLVVEELMDPATLEVQQNHLPE
jgi:hypothetical protein